MAQIETMRARGLIFGMKVSIDPYYLHAKNQLPATNAAAETAESRFCEIDFFVSALVLWICVCTREILSNYPVV